MEEPRLENYGITQAEFEKYQDRTTYLPDSLYLKIIPYGFSILLLIVALTFYGYMVSVSEVREDITTIGKTGAIFGLICVLFFVGFFGAVVGMILGGILSIVIQHIDSYIYKGTHPMYSKVKEYREAKAQYDLYQSRRELEQRQRQEVERVAQRRKEREYWLSFIGHGKAFEKELANLYSNLGYKVIFTSKSSDQGIDLILQKDDKKIIVQCKAHRKPVGPEVARDLYGTLVSAKANEAILASISGFTPGVHIFIQGKRIKLISVNDLIHMQKAIKP